MLQDLAGALDHAHWQRGQACDLDAVAAVGGARLDAAQKQDLVAGFLHRYMQIADAIELARELGQLMVMSCEQRLRPEVAMDVFDYGPGQRESVIGRSAAPDFVQY